MFLLITLYWSKIDRENCFILEVKLDVPVCFACLFSYSCSCFCPYSWLYSSSCHIPVLVQVRGLRVYLIPRKLCFSQLVVHFSLIKLTDLQTIERAPQNVNHFVIIFNLFLKNEILHDSKTNMRSEVTN